MGIVYMVVHSHNKHTQFAGPYEVRRDALAEAANPTYAGWRSGLIQIEEILPVEKNTLPAEADEETAQPKED